jgi:hypothetical protein
MKHSKVRIGKQLSYNFPIQNGVNEGDVLSRLFFSFALEYDVRTFQEIQVRPTLNGTHHSGYADNINTVNRNFN